MQDILDKAAGHSDRIAIISNGNSYKYKDLFERSDSIGLRLLQEARDLEEARIAYLIDPSFEYTATQWGIWKAGGIAVPLCVSHPRESIKYVLEDAEVSKIILSNKRIANLAELAKALDIEILCYEDIMEEEGVLPKIEGSRAAMILYTSGTTSKPKGVVTTHDNISFCISSLVKAWEWKKEDHILNILPLHHVHGIINVMSCALWSGATCEFLPKFNAEAVWEKFLERRLSLFMAVPTIYYKLIKHWKSATEERRKELTESCHSFRLMVSGSAALPVSVLETWKEISGQTLLERYGMTEIGMALSNPYSRERRPGHVGQPLPGVSIRLADEKNIEVREGEQGEIQIKGPNIFKEYWNKPEATKASFTKDGWFKSGDIAVLNNNYYKILGRNSVDIIKSGGYKISALEIESELLKHDGIEQAGVVGIKDDEWGEIVSAAIVSNTITKGEEIIVWLDKKLPGYKIPRKYIFVDDLPKNTLGKVTKNKIKEMF